MFRHRYWGQVNITRAWDQASQLQRNRLLKYLLEYVYIKDKKVIAVTPQPEFIPFFDLQYDGKSNYTLAVRPRGALGSEVQSAYIIELLCPKVNEIGIYPRKLSTLQQAQTMKEHNTKSLRELAREYGVSYETVRRTIRDVYY